jgi:hypothetical protein
MPVLEEEVLLDGTIDMPHYPGTEWDDPEMEDSAKSNVIESDAPPTRVALDVVVEIRSLCRCSRGASARLGKVELRGFTPNRTRTG